MANDVTVNIDIRPVISGIRRDFQDLSQSQVNKAIARSLNDVIVKSKTAASREIRQQYKLKARDIKNAIKPGKASQRKQWATLSVSIRPMPVYMFNPRKTSDGVSVNITGQRRVIKSAFIATMRNGHKGVFARGTYSGKDFTFRKTRIIKTGPDLPIEEIVTASPFSMITNKTVNRHLSQKLQTDFPNSLVRNLLKVRQGY